VENFRIEGETMRMWLCDPRILCQKHLCGEHVEMHMFLGTLKKKRKIDGFLRNNLLQPRLLFQRHEDLKDEMINRGYNHNSCIKESDCECVEDLPDEKKYWEVNREQALINLLERCPQCLKRYSSL
jgi:hypothetical protein